ncbi:MAG TPA: GNAT family N-acyltransferase [bacterium]|nr:GNAT family N-acyltransferase [bacterium]
MSGLEATRGSALRDFASGIPDFEIREGRYRARFARTEEDVLAVLRLRYEVFNLELGEGLAESRLTGLDRDRFDDQCHHLLVEDRDGGRAVGTYRLQHAAMAERGHGFYTDQEYDLSPWRGGVLDAAVETGRACIAREHRHGLVLLLLWQGLGAYAKHHAKQYFFGCCSLTSQDPVEGGRAHAHLRLAGRLHPELHVTARPGWECVADAGSEEAARSFRLPMLFRTYLRYGARICSGPALDREFGTIDFLALLDLRELEPEKILRQLADYVRRSA